MRTNKQSRDPVKVEIAGAAPVVGDKISMPHSSAVEQTSSKTTNYYMIRTKIKCESCGREISKSNYQKHILVCKGSRESFKLNHEGLTCQYCGKECKSRNSLCNHERLCRKNPNRQETYFTLNNEIYPRGENQYTKAKRLGLPAPRYEVSKETREKMSKNNACHRPEVRQKISESMKKAHAEGRAHNIGECRWNNEPSYPEKWIMEVIKNENINPNYKREYSFHRFSLDFAWVDTKKVIEIDGEQHLTDKIQQKRDLEKDRLLKEEGWSELRVQWKDVCGDTRYWIQKIKDFIAR